MAGRGKAAQSKKLAGNPGKRPEGNAPRLPGAPAAPPSLPEEARAEWDRMVILLGRRGDLSELDQAGLADYCLCKVRLEQCEEDIGKRGVLIEGQRGFVKNPALQIARQYRAALQRWVDFFGLAPAPRGRISVPKSEPADDPDGMFG